MTLETKNKSWYSSISPQGDQLWEVEDSDLWFLHSLCPSTYHLAPRHCKLYFCVNLDFWFLANFCANHNTTYLISGLYLVLEQFPSGDIELVHWVPEDRCHQEAAFFFLRLRYQAWLIRSWPCQMLMPFIITWFVALSCRTRSCAGWPGWSAFQVAGARRTNPSKSGSPVDQDGEEEHEDEDGGNTVC